MKEKLIILLFFLPILSFGQDKPLIGKELGILQLYAAEISDKVELLNQDFTVWMNFDFTYGKKLKPGYSSNDIRKLYNWKEEFSPYAFHIDYYLVMFRCLEEKDSLYKVIVNEKTGLIKYIKKSKLWVLKTWDKHIVESVLSIDFDFIKNPIRGTPSNNVETIEINKEKMGLYILPKEINGIWLKVEYQEENKKRIGWLKWRENNQIIVGLFYLD